MKYLLKIKIYILLFTVSIENMSNTKINNYIENLPNFLQFSRQEQETLLDLNFYFHKENQFLKYIEYSYYTLLATTIIIRTINYLDKYKIFYKNSKTTSNLTPFTISSIYIITNILFIRTTQTNILSILDWLNFTFNIIALTKTLSYWDTFILSIPTHILQIFFFTKKTINQKKKNKLDKNIFNKINIYI